MRTWLADKNSRRELKSRCLDTNVTLMIILDACILDLVTAEDVQKSMNTTEADECSPVGARCRIKWVIVHPPYGHVQNSTGYIYCGMKPT